MQKPKGGALLETLKTAFYAALIAVGIRTVAYEPFNIPSGSMIPTLLVGDFLFVSKFSYGYSHHSLPFSLPLIPGRVWADDPERGDVAVFKLPSDDRTDYIKRIVGLPGDTIELKGGILHINGTPVKRERVGDFAVRESSGRVRRLAQYTEILPNRRRHLIIEESDDRPQDNTPVYRVPPDHFFAMGDNRDNSRDSRFAEVGYVPRVNLVGRAEFLFFSIDGSMWEFWRWPQTIRFRRIFSGIE